MTNISILNVFLYNELIGTITNVGGDRTLFAFTESYINNANRATLSLVFKDRLGELIADFKPTQTRLIPFFSNLLPEGEMRRYLAERADVNSEREFFLLWVLGKDLPGAVRVEPADGENYPPAVESLLPDNKKNKNIMRFSLAGVQLKFSAENNATGGLTIPASGIGGSWIVKLPSSAYPLVPENEFAMMELARQVGINVPETQLLKLSDIDNIPDGIGQFGKNAFAIKRFDRADDGSQIHIEDFAQVFGVYPEYKYKKASMRNIASVIAIEGQERDIEEFTRRLVFNNLIGNADMHLKNWSLIYTDKLNASIAPAYDFVSTVPYIDDDKAALKVSRSKRFDEFTIDELSHLAAKARLPEKLVLDTASETVSLFNEVWIKEKNNFGLPKAMIKAIEKHVNIIPLAP